MENLRKHKIEYQPHRASNTKGNHHRLRSDDQGFASIFMLSLLPLILSISFILAAFSTYTYTDLNSKNICRTHLLSQQKATAKTMSLFTNVLNPLATTARIAVPIARALRIASIGTPFFPVAHAIYIAAKIFQKSVHLAQKAALSILNLIKTKIKTETHFKILKLKKHLGLLFSSSVQFSVPTVPFAMDKKPKSNKTPSYTKKPNFFEAQKTIMSWNIDQYNKKFINKLIPIEQRTIKGQCSSTIQHKEAKWKPILVKTGKL